MTSHSSCLLAQPTGFKTWLIGSPIPFLSRPNSSFFLYFYFSFTGGLPRPSLHVFFFKIAFTAVALTSSHDSTNMAALPRAQLLISRCMSPAWPSVQLSRSATAQLRSAWPAIVASPATSKSPLHGPTKLASNLSHGNPVSHATMSLPASSSLFPNLQALCSHGVSSPARPSQLPHSSASYQLPIVPGLHLRPGNTPRAQEKAAARRLMPPMHELAHQQQGSLSRPYKRP